MSRLVGPGARRTAAPPPAGPSTDTANGRVEELLAAAPADVFALLDSRAVGLDATEVEERRRRDGANAIRQVRGPSLLRRLAANFTHLMAVLLWVGALVAFAAELPQIGVAILVVNLVNGTFSFWQEFKAEKATEALRRLLPSYSTVVREGNEHQVLAEDLVVGDVLALAEGDRISADARLVEEVELRVDQSTMTGEAHPVRKTALAVPNGHVAAAESPNLVFAGTSVAAGRGKAVVFAVGMDTRFGAIAHLTQGTAQETSPLQRELSRLSMVVGSIAVGMGVLFFAVAQLLTPMDLALGFVFALGMIVAFVPEGLLPTVTLALAMGTQRMARRQALVKRLSAVETLGSTTVICTDKTGTLTTNQMTVRSLRLASGGFEVTGAGFDPAGDILADGRPLSGSVTGDLRRLLQAGALANDARLTPAENDAGRWQVLGDPTEAALKVLALKGGLDLTVESQRARRVFELPFESSRKRMSTVHAGAATPVLYTKGAPRELLARCTRVLVDGAEVPLDEARRAEFEQANDAYSRDALRVLAVATRTLPEAFPHDAEALEQDLTLVGLVAMLDPPHAEVAEAVVTCRRAGIRILMMTGDYGLTAESIARRVGLVSAPAVRIVNGDELDRMGDNALAEALDGDVIFARTTPEHKLRVVDALQHAGDVVAVTGDGVNDAPALKKADIGVAMGLSGTEVAKEAADMVLLDDNFASIVNAVEEGRAVYANIKKFTGYIFTSNTPEAVPFVLFALSGGRIPIALGVMHILAIDLGTDLAPALALGAERPEPGVMDRPPRPRDEHLVTKGMLWRSYGWLGPLQALTVMVAFYLTFWASGYEGEWLDLPDSGELYRSATAVALAAVVATQIGNLFAHRTERLSVFQVGLGSNRLAFAGIATELFVIGAVVYVPVLQRVVGTAAFPLWYWALLLATAPLLLAVDEVRKAAFRRRERTRR